MYIFPINSQLNAIKKKTIKKSHDKHCDEYKILIKR